MSETNNTGEVERKITVSNEDCDNVRNYSTNFGVKITPELQASMDAFEADQTDYEKMLDFKLEVCKWLTLSGHESFEDNLWAHPKESANDIMYDLQFDKELEEVLDAEDETTKASEVSEPSEPQAD